MKKIFCALVAFLSLLLATAASLGQPVPAYRPKPLLILRGNHAVRFSPDGACLATLGPSNAVVLWDATVGKKLRALNSQAEDYIGGFAFSADGRQLVACGERGSANVWDMTTGKVILTVPVRETRMVSQVSFSSSGRCFISGIASGEPPEGGIIIHDAHTGKRVFTRVGLSALPIQKLAHSSDGRRLVTAGASGTFTVWEMATWSPVLTLKGSNTSAVLAVAFSPDGRRVAAADSDGLVRVWSLPSGLECFHLRGHKGRASCVAFDPSGRWLASAGQVTGKKRALRWASEVIIWDMVTGEERNALLFPEGQSVYDLSFNPSGTRLATLHADGTIKVWFMKDIIE